MFAFLFLCLPDPPLTDLDRFPPAPVVCRCLTFARQREAYLTPQRFFNPGDHTLASEATDLAVCRHSWELLRAAGPLSDLSVRDRRRVLGELREWLGGEAYFAGRMPWPGTVGRFASED